MDPYEFRSDPHADRPSIADREVDRTPESLYQIRRTETLGARFDALMGDDDAVVIDRPAGAIDLLLSGWVVPYAAEIDGVVVPVACEAAWWDEQRRAGRGKPKWSPAPPRPGSWVRATEEERGESARRARLGYHGADGRNDQAFDG